MLQNRFLKTMFITGLIFGLCFAFGNGVVALYQHLNAATPVSQKDDEKTPASEPDGKRTNILLLGVDARPGDDHSRSDTMMLLSIDPELDKAALVSIPRDTRMDHTGTSLDKICAANYVGGPRYAQKKVEELMQTQIDYYVEMDFNGFKKVVDTLGGITINVPCSMYKPSEGINLKPGLQKLNGSQALGLVRFREYPLGDIQRTAVQQDFMKTLAGELLQAKTITRLPALIREANKYVNTDMTLTDALRLAKWAPGFNKDSLVAQTLPGSFYDERDEYGNLLSSYWIVDKKQVAGLLDKMFSGQTVAVVQEGAFTSNTAASGSNNNAGTQSAQDSEQELNQERSGLSSPGHEQGAPEETPPVETLPSTSTGPEQGNTAETPPAGEKQPSTSGDNEQANPPETAPVTPVTGPDGYI